MAKNKDIVPADLYVQAPKNLKLKDKGAFARFVHQFPPEYFIEADVDYIVYLLDAHRRFQEISDELRQIEFYITENDQGTESVHPLWKVRESLVKEIGMWSGYLRIAPLVREPYFKEAGRGTGLPEKKTVRIMYNYNNEQPVFKKEAAIAISK